MSNYEKLFTPLQIGSITVKNRYAVGPMGGRHFIYNSMGAYSENGIDYWVELARGGFGLIVTGSNVANLTVDPFDPANGNPNPATHPGFFGHGARTVLERVHDYGGRMFLQISMGPGRMRDGKSCSAIPKYKEPDKLTDELTKEEIETKIADMIKLAKLAKGWGYDGVEIHGMHWGYLLDQFAMAYTNHRTDEYGGDLNGRLTVHRKIIQGIKAACGRDFPVSMRMCMKTFMAGYNKSTLTGENEVGRSIEEAVEIAKRFESYGVDMLNVNTGTYDTFYYCVGPYYMPKGYNIQFARHVKRAVSIPVFVAGKMDDPEMCERAIADGSIDGVTLARASLADSHYPEKVYMGKEDSIRPCISCTNCIETNLAGGVPLCSVNPTAMHELIYGVSKAPVRKKVLIIGGGVAGMEAARTCQLRGHDVELYEASGKLGGHLIEAGSHPFKDGIAALNRWYQRELAELCVKVNLNCPMDADKIKALRPDAVILAVGSTHFMPKIPGIDHYKTAGCYDVLMKNVKPGKKVVVVGGGMTGCELAYDLAAYEHCDVTLVEALDSVMSSGPVVPKAVKTMLLDLLDHYNVKIMAGNAIAAVNDGGAVIRSMASGTETTLEADTVVMAIGLRPRGNMTAELAGSGIQVYTTGDALQVGNIRTCVSGAYEIARNI